MTTSRLPGAASRRHRRGILTLQSPSPTCEPGSSFGLKLVPCLLNISQGEKLAGHQLSKGSLLSLLAHSLLQQSWKKGYSSSFSGDESLLEGRPEAMHRNSCEKETEREWGWKERMVMHKTKKKRSGSET